MILDQAQLTICDTSVAAATPPVRLVITDIDGTLAPFWTYFIPAMQEFSRHLSIGGSAKQIIADLLEVMARRGTNEHPWMLEETSFARQFADIPDRFYDRIVDPFWQIMDSQRKAYLRPFPEVRQTLSRLRAYGIKVVALTNSPYHMAQARVSQHFDGLLDSVYALAVSEPSAHEVFHEVAINKGYDRMDRVCSGNKLVATRLVVLPRHYEKPHRGGLERILSDYGVHRSEAIYIGDQLNRDGLVAGSVGIPFVWSRYGAVTTTDNDLSVTDSMADLSTISQLGSAAKFSDIGTFLFQK